MNEQNTEKWKTKENRKQTERRKIERMKRKTKRKKNVSQQTVTVCILRIKFTSCNCCRRTAAAVLARVVCLPAFRIWFLTRFLRAVLARMGFGIFRRMLLVLLGRVRCRLIAAAVVIRSIAARRTIRLRIGCGPRMTLRLIGRGRGCRLIGATFPLGRRRRR